MARKHAGLQDHAWRPGPNPTKPPCLVPARRKPTDSVLLIAGNKYTVHFTDYEKEGFDARFSITEGKAPFNFKDSANFWVACDLPDFAPNPLLTPDKNQPLNVDYVGDGAVPFSMEKYSNKSPR
jgi:hypothetical protein